MITFHLDDSNYEIWNFQIELVFVRVDLKEPKFWTDVVPESEKDVIESAYAVNGSQLILSYLSDVKYVLQIRDLKLGSFLHNLPIDIGSVYGISGRRQDNLVFISFTSFLSPGIIYQCNLETEVPEMKIFREISVPSFDRNEFQVKQVFVPSKDGMKIPMFIVSRPSIVQLKQELQGIGKNGNSIEQYLLKYKHVRAKSSVVGVKYPSKLHERLAYLEGKVNRIASDIKQTKEMLAINNPDASKLILTDIQEKILGIEKAIDCVGGDSIVDMVPVKISEDDNGLSKEIDQWVEKKDAKWTYLDKGRSSEDTSSSFNDNHETGIILMTNETIDQFDDENTHDIIMDCEIGDACINQLYEIGCKISTAGWFVSEGESVLAHDDGSCTFYDIANCETKAEYMPPTQVSSNIWKDCWIICAPDADGCSGKYVVAASAGNNFDSGFCSWSFYEKDVRAFHIENSHTAPRTVLAPLPNNSSYRTNMQCWYKPCGPQPQIGYPC